MLCVLSVNSYTDDQDRIPKGGGDLDPEGEGALASHKGHDQVRQGREEENVQCETVYFELFELKVLQRCLLLFTLGWTLFGLNDGAQTVFKIVFFVW